MDQTNAYGTIVDAIIQPIELVHEELRPALTYPEVRIVAADFRGDLPEFGFPPKITVVLTDKNGNEHDAEYILPIYIGPAYQAYLNRINSMGLWGRIKNVFKPFIIGIHRTSRLK